MRQVKFSQGAVDCLPGALQQVLKAVPDARKFSSGLLGAFTPGAVREASTQLGAPRNSEGARVSVEPDSEA